MNKLLPPADIKIRESDPFMTPNGWKRVFIVYYNHNALHEFDHLEDAFDYAKKLRDGDGL